MKQERRSALALGICSRNGPAAFVAFAAFPVQDPNVLVMLVMASTLPAIVWFLLAFFFAFRAEKVAGAAVV